MVKKANNTTRIDFKKCIVEERLLQIRPTSQSDVPELCNVWTLEIDRQNSKNFIDLVRTCTRDQDPISLQHIKRIKKIMNKDGDKLLLKCILCSTEFSDVKEEIAQLISFPYDNLSCETKVPREGPQEKDQLREWSEKYWPLVWNGNPNDQILNDSVFVMEDINFYLKLITSRAKEIRSSTGQMPIITAFVDPRSNAKRKYILVEDERIHNKTEGLALPIDHSIMVGIQKIAQMEKSDRANQKIVQNYLCLDFDVYTTHEPCSMCSMALIHSRIKRCIFIKDMNKTGSFLPTSGDSYCMHANKKLNFKYEVFQWIGSEYKVPDINGGICA